jgi:acyl-homoserine lactone acylase PvdQ
MINCDDYAVDAFEKAVSESAGMKWGIDLHRVRVEHQVLSASPLDCLSGRWIQHGGTPDTVNVGAPNFGDSDWKQTAGPSYRGIFDLSGNFTNSKIIYPMGQSGNMFSRRFDDWLQMWSDGEYWPLLVRDYEVKAELTISSA